MNFIFIAILPLFAFISTSNSFALSIVDINYNTFSFKDKVQFSWAFWKNLFKLFKIAADLAANETVESMVVKALRRMSAPRTSQFLKSESMMICVLDTK